MKASTLTTLVAALLLLTPSVAAQVADPAAPTDVVILEKSWRAESRSFMHNTNPLEPNEELIRVTREQKKYLREQDNAPPNQTTTPPMPASLGRPIFPEPRSRKTYLYQVKVMNAGAKAIKQINWEYQFLDPDTREVKDQRKIASSVKLSPGQSKVLKSRLTRQPTVVVNAGQLAQQYKNQFAERVVITRIVYADGSTWQPRQ
jgi:hypothetical protein